MKTPKKRLRKKLSVELNRIRYERRLSERNKRGVYSPEIGEVLLSRQRDSRGGLG